MKTTLPGLWHAFRHPRPSDPAPCTAARTGRPWNHAPLAPPEALHHLATPAEEGDADLMPDFRIDEKAPEHPKLRAAGLAAAGLWAMAGAHSMKEGTDGWVPAYWVGTWPSGKRYANTLVKVGLWTVEARNGIPGYRFHDFLDYQRSAKRIEEEREKARQRMSALRAGQSQQDAGSGDVRPNTRRTGIGAVEGGMPAALFDSATTSAPSCPPGDNSTEPTVTSDNVIPFGRTSGERSPNVHDSLSLKAFGAVRGEGHVGRRVRDEPPTRCMKHEGQPDDGTPCGPCADARRARQAWDADQARIGAEREAAERQAAAAARRLAIANCRLCDDQGYVGGRLCDHNPIQAEVNAGGLAKAWAAIGGRPTAGGDR